MFTKPLHIRAALILTTIVLAGILWWTGSNAVADGDASLALNPPSQAVQAGDIFTVNIVATTGTGSVDTVDAYLDFDPAYLEVVESSGVPATSIEANAEIFSFITINSVDNSTGKINFSATQLGSPLTGTFTVATIRFRAKPAIDTTDITFVRSGARHSDLYHGGAALDVSLTNGVVTGMCLDFVAPSGVDVNDVEFVALKWGELAAGELYDCDGDEIVTVRDILCVARKLGDPCLGTASRTSSTTTPTLSME